MVLRRLPPRKNSPVRGLWYAIPLAVQGLRQMGLQNHSTFVAVQGEEFYTLFGYYCDNDLRWELAEEQAKEVTL